MYFSVAIQNSTLELVQTQSMSDNKTKANKANLQARTHKGLGLGKYRTNQENLNETMTTNSLTATLPVQWLSYLFAKSYVPFHVGCAVLSCGLNVNEQARNQRNFFSRSSSIQNILTISDESDSDHKWKRQRLLNLSEPASAKSNLPLCQARSGLGLCEREPWRCFWTTDEAFDNLSAQSSDSRLHTNE